MARQSRQFIGYYDEWTVPSTHELPNGITLKAFVRRVQDHLRKGYFDNVFNELNSVPLPCRGEDKVDPLCAFSSLLLGIARRKASQPQIARVFVYHALNHFSAVSDIANSVRCNIALGDTWRAQARLRPDEVSDEYWRKATMCYNAAERELKSLEPKHSVSSSLILLKAQILWAQARLLMLTTTDPKTVEHKLLEAWKLCTSVNSIWGEEEAAQLLGRNYESQGDIDQAKHWYQVSLDKASNSGNIDRLIESSLYLAKLSQKTEDTSELMQYLSLAESKLEPLLTQKLTERHQYNDFLQEIQALKKNAYGNMSS